MPTNKIQILYTVATFMFNEAAHLFGIGTGEDIHGRDLSIPGQLDGIPIGTPEYEWANATARLLRYIANVLALALEEEQNNMLDQTAFSELDENLENDSDSDL